MKKGERTPGGRELLPKILVIYGGSQFPGRKSGWSHLYSFRKYAKARVYYHNEFFVKRPWWVPLVRFDAVVFHNSVTTPWSRARFPKRIARYEKADFGGAYRIGLFQDEFHNSDLACEFINRVRLDQVCTVAPESEWRTIYRDVDFAKTRFVQVLTGYIDEEDVELSKKHPEHPRTVDIGYRSEWAPSLYRTGTFGYQKYLIAERTNAAATRHGLRTDVTTAPGTAIRGEAWFDFVRNCRYLLGTESGSGLLDWDGSIEKRIAAYVAQNPTATFEEAREKCFRAEDGNLRLQVISPRHLEAAVHRTGQILVEGTYSGILQPHVHYLPVAPDFSNLDTALAAAKDEPARLTMVERTYRDVVASGRYHYRAFVAQVLAHVPGSTPSAAVDRVLWPVAKVLDFGNWVKAFLLGNAYRFVVARLRRASA